MSRKKSISRRLYEEARDHFKKFENNKTRQTYTFAYRKFICYCRTAHDAKTKEECLNCVDAYINFLKSHGRSASTIHTYVAAICNFHNVPMGNYKIPKRYTSEYSRGRIDNNKKKRKDSDLNNTMYKRLVEFQKRVGLRRSELRRLKKNDFIEDTEHGTFYVICRRGKGGKYQEQFILPRDIPFIKEYFDGSNSPVFTTEEMRNKLPLHYLRAKYAQRSYKYFLSLTKKPKQNKNWKQTFAPGGTNLTQIKKRENPNHFPKN